MHNMDVSRREEVLLYNGALMNRPNKPILSQFEVEIQLDNLSVWNSEFEMTSSDQVCSARLISNDLESINGLGTKTTRVNGETVDDD